MPPSGIPLRFKYTKPVEDEMLSRLALVVWKRNGRLVRRNAVASGHGRKN